MSLRKLLTLSLIGLGAIGGALAADQEPIVEEIPDDQTGKLATLKVQIDTAFKDDDFGIKLVNGHATAAQVSVFNAEEDVVSVRMIGGSLWNLDDKITPTMNLGSNVRNLTSTSYNVDIPPQGNVSLTYSFATEMHPQDLRLLLAAIIFDKAGNGYQMQAFNGTVSIVEAPLSMFDPQMIFLYFLLGGVFGLTVYFIFNTWLKTFFPQAKKTRGKRERKTAPPAASLSSGDETAKATGSGKGYDESWIPQHHIQRPDARRARSGTPKTRAK